MTGLKLQRELKLVSADLEWVIFLEPAPPQTAHPVRVTFDRGRWDVIGNPVVVTVTVEAAR